MSRHDYEMSREIAGQGYSFAALIMAAIRKADTDNKMLLLAAWPEIARELQARYNAPGGFVTDDLLPTDFPSDLVSKLPRL
jgi:hypothetical protein